MTEFDPKRYKHFVLADNHISHEIAHMYIIKLDHPACSIRFNHLDAQFATYEEFYNGIADPQFFTADRPPDEEVEVILTDAWNFFVLEDNKLEIDEQLMDDNEFQFTSFQKFSPPPNKKLI